MGYIVLQVHDVNSSHITFYLAYLKGLSHNDFLTQKVYFFRLMRVYVGLIVLAVYFVIPADHKWSIINCSLIKMDWLAACIALRVVGAVLIVFLRRWGKTVLQAMVSKGWYLKKCPKPCWPIRSKESWTKYTRLTLLSHINYKNVGAPKKFKIYLGLELTIHVIQSQTISCDSPYYGRIHIHIQNDFQYPDAGSVIIADPNIDYTDAENWLTKCKSTASRDVN